MPIYEYACAACGHHMEIMQSIKDAPLRQCPSCRKRKLKKLVSAAGFQLKGTGWYVTDFRDQGKPIDKKGKAKAEPAGENKAEGTAKPGTGAESKKPTEKTDKGEKKK